MEVLVEHLGDMQFEIRARSHTIACDQPVESGGYDEGMTPPELFLASLGSCAAFYAADYLRKQRLAREGATVSVTAEKFKKPARLDNFVIRVHAPIELTGEQEAGLAEAVRGCLLHNTLLHPPSISIEVAQAAPAAVGAPR